MAERVAIVAGVRTPFLKAGTAFAKMSAVELGTAAVAELVGRAGVPPREIERVVFGQVVPSLSAPNIAREVVLDAGLPRDVDAYSVTRACATSYQSTIDVAQAIAAGDIACGIAGGADCVSDVPFAASRNLAQAMVRLERARGLRDRIRALGELSARDLVPQPPALRERSTGLTMGEHAERMAHDFAITRAAQDEYALRSHRLAAAAWDDGRLGGEVMTVFVPPGYETSVSQDNLVRRRIDLATLAKLAPVFDDKGTITAGNSSALTDGGAALLLLREDRARALGLAPLAFVRSHAFVAVDPHGALLIGPAFAIPKALARAGVRFSDLALLDLHEAFAAQVLAVVQSLESRTWAQANLGKDEATGTIDWDRFNVSGGSIAIGHPFAATGARQILQVSRELARRGGGLACISACAAGGLGAAIVLEVPG